MTALVVVLAALVAGQFGLSRYRSHQYAAQAQKLAVTESALAASVAARKRSERALVLVARKNAAAAQETASARASLHAAKASSPSWASEPVPEAVQQAFKDSK
jgi:hypothetical protein